MTVNPKQEKPSLWAIVVGAGSGTRFKTKVPKQFCRIGKEVLLHRTIRSLLQAVALDGMVVVVPKDWTDRAQALPLECRNSNSIKVVAGGKRRSDSVRLGLQQVSAQADLILIHDGVRPRIAPGLVERLVRQAFRSGACVPVLQLFDTIKRVDQEGKIVETLDRDTLRRVQTPQVFRKEVLMGAYAWMEAHCPDSDFTDESAMVSQSGHQVDTLLGDPKNIKITQPQDLLSLVLELPRVGHGYDVHRLVPDRPLMLGGVSIESTLGLLGHSDGDAALHALCDALLGAAGMEDIGHHFPDSDPAYAGVASGELVCQVRKKITKAGFNISSVDLTLVAQQPRLAPYLSAMKAQIGRLLELGTERIGIKATTEEGLGVTGKSEGIAVHAIAVLGVWGE